MDTKSHFIITLAEVSQVKNALKGPFLKGHREPRLAMVGRSNVGKSSLINRLLGCPLARTSKQPGKTRALHFYLWGEKKKILADLPGYGYARASKDERDRWETFISAYLDSDTHLERALVLLDSRHGPTPEDRKVMEFLSLKRIPITVVFTKVDLLRTQSERAARTREATQALVDLGIDLNSVFWVSSSSKIGLKELVRSFSIPLNSTRGSEGQCQEE